MATFVLIHGAYHGGWCWEVVAPLLEAAGHTVRAPDLPGLGGDPTPHDHVTLDTTADFVVRLIESQVQPVVLVGHSMGGAAISEVAERIPDGLAGLVYVAAVLSFEAVTETQANEALARHRMAPSADGLSMVYDPAAALAVMYNTTEPARAQRAIARFTPQPMATLASHPRTTAARFGRVARAYVECTEDLAIPLAWQRQMQAQLPCDPVFTLKTDHSPFFSAPGALADCLIAAAAKFA